MEARKRSFAALLLLSCFIFPPGFSPGWWIAGRVCEPVAVSRAEGRTAPNEADLFFFVLPSEENQATPPRANDRRRENGSNSSAAIVPPPAEPSPTAAVPASHWVAAEVAALIRRTDLGQVLSDPWHLDEPVTRGEFASFLGRLLASVRSETLEAVRETEAGPAGRPSPFLDVPPQAPYASRLADLQRLGLFAGTAQGRFSPERLLTRLELMVVAGRVVRLGVQNVRPAPQLPGGSVLTAYEDQALVPGWARADVELALAAGIIRGRPGGILVPHAPATRAETLAVLARLLPRLPVEEVR